MRGSPLYLQIIRTPEITSFGVTISTHEVGTLPKNSGSNASQNPDRCSIQDCKEESTGLARRAISACAETFYANQFVSKLRVRFLACVFSQFQSHLVAFGRFSLPLVFFQFQSHLGDFRYRFRTKTLRASIEIFIPLFKYTDFIHSF